MRFDHLFDWAFFYDFLENILASVMPFLTMRMAIAAVGALIGIIVAAFAYFSRKG